MIDVSPEFKQALSEDNRNYIERATITLQDETVLNLTEANIWGGGFSIDDSVSGDTVFTVGSAIINKATLVINNIYGDYSEYDFTGAIIEMSVGLALSEEDEIIKKGTYIEQKTKYNGTIITIEMYDYMSKFDVAYSTNLAYPLRLIDILQDSCTTCGVTLATSTFPNSTTPISTMPTNATHREVVSWIAGLAGCFARCNTDGELELKWFDTSSIESEDDSDGGRFDSSTPYATGDSKDGGIFNPWNTGDVVDGGSLAVNSNIHYIMERYSGEVSVDDVVITCVKVTAKTTDGTGAESIIERTVGTEGYAVKLEENGFVTEDNIQYIATFLASRLVGLRFRVANISHPSDPTIEAGDVALYYDRHGNGYRLLVTRTAFTAGEPQTTSCDAESPARNSAERFSERTKNYVELRKIIADNADQAEALIAELQEQVDNIEVGGVNLLRNTQDYFMSGLLELDGCLYTQNCDLIGHYKDCAIAVYDNTDSSSLADAIAWHNVMVELRTTYTLSFWAKADTITNPTIYTYFYGETGYPTVAKGVSSEGTENTNTDGLMPFTLTSDWKRYWVKWTIADQGNIEIPKWVLFRVAGLATASIAGVKLEEGSINTYYSPSPEDTEEAIERLRNTSRYGTCETSSDVQEKIVELPNFVLDEGTQFAVTFVNGNETERMMLDVNGTGAKFVTVNNDIDIGNKIAFPSGTTASFVYDGSTYRFVASDNLYNVLNWSPETGLDIRAEEGSLSRVNINNQSVDVYDADGNVGTRTSSDGFEVYKGGTKVASFGERIVLGEEDVGSRIELGRSAIEFYEKATRTAYVAEDKFYFINGEVTQSFFFPDYSVREDTNKNIVISKR